MNDDQVPKRSFGSDGGSDTEAMVSRYPKEGEDFRRVFLLHERRGEGKARIARREEEGQL